MEDPKTATEQAEFATPMDVSTSGESQTPKTEDVAVEGASTESSSGAQPEAAERKEEKEEEEEAEEGEECQICSNLFKDGELTGLACSHRFCKECWATYLASEFDEKRKSFLDLVCPGYKCTQKLTDSDYRRLMSEKTLANYEAVWKTIPERARSFHDFNYAYDENGILRNTINGDKFHWVNQAHYDALGDLIIDYIQNKMKEDYKMEEVWLPLGAEEGAIARNNIFLSPNALQADKLILLIQGSGAVRPGLWARALFIHDSLDLGSILPYLKRIQEAGWGVIVFNPNQNAVFADDEGDADLKCREAFLSTKKIIRPARNVIRIPGSETPSRHCVYVWDNFVTKAAASQICIIAHSAGGACTMDLLRERETEALPRLRGVAFTDSVHWVSPRDPPAVRRFIKEHAINWVKSDAPLDTPVKSHADDGCPCISAGHPKHEFTSGCAITSVFKFLAEKFGVQ